jgi:uncharacterized protein YjbJ (UPF0337 family)
MSWEEIKGDWHQLSRRLKEKWRELTEDDLKSIGGRREQLEGLLQKRYGYDKERAGIELDKFTTSLTS